MKTIRKSGKRYEIKRQFPSIRDNYNCFLVIGLCADQAGFAVFFSVLTWFSKIFCSLLYLGSQISDLSLSIFPNIVSFLIDIFLQ